MKTVILTQRIITPERTWELPVFFQPEQWYRGPYPTSVSLEGEIPQEVLERLITYASLLGWRWDETMRRFYPTDTDITI